MRALFSWHHFDALLRGKLSAADRIRFPLTWLAWQVVCAGLFGASLGVYALTSRETPDLRYLLAGAVKVPLLLIFTSGITVPSLYVFGALRGLRFSAREFGAHLMVAHTILAAVLGSLAPVLAFFALTTSSYSFMVLFDVFACTVAGALGVRAFVAALSEPDPDVPQIEAAPSTEVAPAPTTVAPAPRAIAKLEPSAGQLLRTWLFLYCFVGSQAGWILRPFIGQPELPFVLLRGKEGGFFSSVFHHLMMLLTGHG